MKVFSAQEAAQFIGCDARALRRFLRSNDSWRNAGIGGRYTFSESEMHSLKLQFEKAAKKGLKTQEVKHQSAPLDIDPGVPVEKLGRHGLLPSVRADRQKARAERKQRLRARMDEVLTERYDDEPVSNMNQAVAQ